jgi:hypothetical protein
MRLALVLLALAACTVPALAQKNAPPSGSAPAGSPTTTQTPSAPVASVASQLASTCLRFARGDADAESQAEAEGWDVDQYGTEGSYLGSMGGSRNISGIGDANIFGSFETYPTFTLRFCRVDLTLNADAPQIGVETLTGWENVEGGVREAGGGIYGSWNRTESDPDTLLLVIAQQDAAATVQVTMLTFQGEN